MWADMGNRVSHKKINFLSYLIQAIFIDPASLKNFFEKKKNWKKFYAHPV